MEYDLSICNCGRIHVIPYYKVQEAIDKEKELLMICGGCGKALRLGADKMIDFDTQEEVYEMYSRKVKEVDMKQMGDFAEVIIDEGLKVPMMTGEYANSYVAHKFFRDMLYPDDIVYLLQDKNMTADELREKLEKWYNDRCTVNVDRFILMYKDLDDGDVLRELSHYELEGLSLKGTKYYDR